MKKLTVVLLAALCVIALAPRDLAAGVGIKGGYSLAKFSLTPSEDGSGLEVPAVLGGRRLLRFQAGVRVRSTRDPLHPHGCQDL